MFHNAQLLLFYILMTAIPSSAAIATLMVLIFPGRFQKTFRNTWLISSVSSIISGGSYALWLLHTVHVRNDLAYQGQGFGYASFITIFPTLIGAILGGTVVLIHRLIKYSQSE